MERREFIKNSAMAAATFAILPSGSLFASAPAKVRLGYIGVGARGMSHIAEGLLRDDIEVVAICDTQESSLKICREFIAKKGHAPVKEYTGGLDAYKRLLDHKDIDAVIIATPWAFHYQQSIDAMKAGKYVGCEVIAGLTVDEHWDIVHTSEKTGMPYMTLENVCYRRDVMAALNMVRQNVFGEIVHLEGGYQHNLRGVLFNNGDVTTTMINCANGETVLLSHDTHLPRPYSLGFRVQGTKGIWMDVNKSVYIDHQAKQDDVWDPAKLWFDKYDHPLWKKYEKEAEGAGHGGMDWFVFNAFVEAVKQKKQTPIDVYDSVTMSVITPLSTKSLKEGNASVEFPDFTKGKWKERKSTFALDDSGF
jgi:hypothetical protein